MNLELAVCNETRHEQIQNQRKRTKKISAAAESDFIAGKQAEFAHSTQQKSMNSAEHERNAARSRQSREQPYFYCRRYPG